MEPPRGVWASLWNFIRFLPYFIGLLILGNIKGLFLPAVVRPILDSFEASKQVPQPALSDVVAGMTGKK